MAAKKKAYMKLRITVFVLVTILLAVSLLFSTRIEKALGLAEGEGTITQGEFEHEGSEDVEVVRTGEAVIHFIDVGQGDATLIEVPAETEDTDDTGEANAVEGTFILIDGGSDDGGKHAARNSNGNLKLMDYLDGTVGQIENFVFDYVILTHQHEDHCGGLNDVLNKYPSRIVYRPNNLSTYKNGDPLMQNIDKLTNKREKFWGNGATKYPTNTKTYNDFLQAAYKTRFLSGDAQITKEVRVTNANTYAAGENYDTKNVITGKDGTPAPQDFELRFHTPTKDVYGDANDYSPVITFDFNGKRTLISGDAAKEAEAEFCNIGDSSLNAEVDIFRVGHHGSETSSSAAFIDKITKAEARENIMLVISVGLNNDYDHPKPVILNRFTSMGFNEDNILRTDVNGDIVMAVKFDAELDEYVIMFGAAMIRTYTPGEEPPLPLKWWQIALALWVVAMMVIFTIHINKKGQVKTGAPSSRSRQPDTRKSNNSTGKIAGVKPPSPNSKNKTTNSKSANTRKQDAPQAKNQIKRK